MNISSLRAALCGLLLFFIPFLGCATDTTSVSGRTAIDIFHDPQVVALIDAVVDGNVAKAKGLMAAGANINASGDAGVTPLIWMIYAHNDRAIKLLLDLGANPNQAWDQGEAPVYMAASGGNLKLLKLLLDHGGDPDSPAHSNSAMMIAMIQLHLDCAELLLQRGADINYHHEFSSAIAGPMIVGRFEWVIWLLDHGYTYDLARARRGVSNTVPTAEEAPWKAKALERLDQRIRELNATKDPAAAHSAAVAAQPATKP